MEKHTTTPWDDCKVAFGVNDGGVVWDKLEKPLWLNRLPAGWEPTEADGAGARWVIVFRVRSGMPAIEDGHRVRQLLNRLEPRRKRTS